MDIRENNKAKITQLLPRVQWALTALEEEAWNNGLAFIIAEVRRTKERQLELYNQPWDGKDNDGDGLIDEADELVTWTLNSLHIVGLAADLYSYADGVPNFYPRLKEMAKKYGITFPLQGAPYYDQGHAQFDNVPPEPVSQAGEMAQKGLLRRLTMRLSRMTGGVYLRALERIKKRFPLFNS